MAPPLPFNKREPLMLRISQATTDNQTTLRLEGEISGQWVEELRRECARASRGDTQAGRRLVLDLAEVSSIDAAGLALFRELSARRAIVTKCSPYVEELLKDVVEVDK
jgi:anti-anti-sigma factor